MPKILVNLFFRVPRMTDEDGRIERGERCWEYNKNLGANTLKFQVSA
jgi:hypothetical protein